MATKKGNKRFLVDYEMRQRAKLPRMHEFHTEGADNGSGGRAFQAQIALYMHDYDTNMSHNDGKYYGYVRECKCGGGKWVSNASEEISPEEVVKILVHDTDFIVWTDDYCAEDCSAFCFKTTPDFIHFLIENDILTLTHTRRDGCLWRVHHGGESSPMWKAVEGWEWYTVEEMMEYCRNHRK